eukprot:g394.t1
MESESEDVPSPFTPYLEKKGNFDNSHIQLPKFLSATSTIITTSSAQSSCCPVEALTTTKEKNNGSVSHEENREDQEDDSVQEEENHDNDIDDDEQVEEVHESMWLVTRTPPDFHPLKESRNSNRSNVSKEDKPIIRTKREQQQQQPIPLVNDNNQNENDDEDSDYCSPIIRRRKKRRKRAQVLDDDDSEDEDIDENNGHRNRDHDTATTKSKLNENVIDLTNSDDDGQVSAKTTQEYETSNDIVDSNSHDEDENVDPEVEELDNFFETLTPFIGMLSVPTELPPSNTTSTRTNRSEEEEDSKTVVEEDSKTVVEEDISSDHCGSVSSQPQLQADNNTLIMNEIATICNLTNTKLVNHQLQGVKWLLRLYENDVNGILCDEMGLGKTVQTIVLLSIVRNRLLENTHSKKNNLLSVGRIPPPAVRFLVIAPSSILENWSREFKKFAPSIHPFIYNGTSDNKIAMKKKLRENKIDVLIVSYTRFERNSNSAQVDRKALLSAIGPFSAVILDEAHCIKNSGSQRFAIIQDFCARNDKSFFTTGSSKQQGQQRTYPLRLLLTGTPIQNNLRELLTLMLFANPVFFAGKYANHSNKRKQRKSQKILLNALVNIVETEDDTNNDTSNSSRLMLQQFLNAVQLFILRRRKAQVLKDLPSKTEYIEKVTMTGEQIAMYRDVKEQLQTDIREYKMRRNNPTGQSGIHAKTTAQHGQDVVPIIGNKNRYLTPPQLMSSAFTVLRKIANHPLLVRNYYTDKRFDEIVKALYSCGAFQFDRSADSKLSNFELTRKELATLSDFEIYETLQENTHRNWNLTKYLFHERLLFESGKIKRLLHILKTIFKNDGDGDIARRNEEKDLRKVLVFSQWTSILDILSEVLAKEYPKIIQSRIDGNVTVSERQEIIDEFSSNPDCRVFLLSTRAGGVGLNLTAADTVILHDVDFNPAQELQAMDRVHRFGQTREVTVYRLVGADTVDERIWQISKGKSRKVEMYEKTSAQASRQSRTNGKSHRDDILRLMLEERNDQEKEA